MGIIVILGWVLWALGAPWWVWVMYAMSAAGWVSRYLEALDIREFMLHHATEEDLKRWRERDPMSSLRKNALRSAKDVSRDP